VLADGLVSIKDLLVEETAEGLFDVEVTYTMAYDIIPKSETSSRSSDSRFKSERIKKLDPVLKFA